MPSLHRHAAGAKRGADRRGRVDHVMLVGGGLVPEAALARLAGDIAHFVLETIDQADIVAGDQPQCPPACGNSPRTLPMTVSCRECRSRVDFSAGYELDTMGCGPSWKAIRQDTNHPSTDPVHADSAATADAVSECQT